MRLQPRRICLALTSAFTVIFIASLHQAGYGSQPPRRPPPPKRGSSPSASSTQQPMLESLPAAGNETTGIQANELRRRHLTAACARYSNSSVVTTKEGWRPGPIDDMLVEDNLKLLYCPVGKVATRSWKYVLLRAAGRPIAMGKADNRHILEKFLPQLRRFKKSGDIDRRLQTYFKFLVVREPLERFVSAYNYLFKLSAYYQGSFGPDIIRRYRPNATENALKSGRGVTIEEFVRYVVDEYRAGKEPLDRHWRPQHQLCHPCQVRYDYVAHYETMESDADAIVRLVGVKDRIQFPFHKWKKTTPRVLGKVLNRVPRDLLRQLKDVYAPDYELFGFPMPTL